MFKKVINKIYQLKPKLRIFINFAIQLLSIIIGATCAMLYGVGFAPEDAFYARSAGYGHHLVPTLYLSVFFGSYFFTFMSLSLTFDSLLQEIQEKHKNRLILILVPVAVAVLPFFTHQIFPRTSWSKFSVETANLIINDFYQQPSIDGRALLLVNRDRDVYLKILDDEDCYLMVKNIFDHKVSRTYDTVMFRSSKSSEVNKLNIEATVKYFPHMGWEVLGFKAFDFDKSLGLAPLRAGDEMFFSFSDYCHSGKPLDIMFEVGDVDYWRDHSYLIFE